MRESLRHRIVSGAASLEVRALTPSDLASIAWSGGQTHLENVAQQLERVPTGDVEYLLVLADGHPVCKGGVDFAKGVRRRDHLAARDTHTA